MKKKRNLIKNKCGLCNPIYTDVLVWPSFSFIYESSRLFLPLDEHKIAPIVEGVCLDDTRWIVDYPDTLIRILRVDISLKFHQELMVFVNNSRKTNFRRTFFYTCLSRFRTITLTVLLSLATFKNLDKCELQLLGLVVGYLVILGLSMAIELAICVVAMRGSILNTAPRASMQYILYFRVGKVICYS
jgi:hypothetical protein